MDKETKEPHGAQLSENDWARIQQWMRERGALQCSVCNNQHWRKTETAVALRNVKRDYSYIAIMVSCTHCGTVRLLDANLIFPEWWQEEEND